MVVVVAVDELDRQGAGQADAAQRVGQRVEEQRLAGPGLQRVALARRHLQHVRVGQPVARHRPADHVRQVARLRLGAGVTAGKGQAGPPVGAHRVADHQHALRAGRRHHVQPARPLPEDLAGRDPHARAECRATAQRGHGRRADRHAVRMAAGDAQVPVLAHVREPAVGDHHVRLAGQRPAPLGLRGTVADQIAGEGDPPLPEHVLVLVEDDGTVTVEHRRGPVVGDEVVEPVRLDEERCG